MTNLVGQAALVTGGGRGIGFAIASKLASQGASVMIADREGAQEAAGRLAAAGQIVRGRQVELREIPQIEDMVAATVGELGGIGIVVNCAGIEYGGTFFEVTPEVWDAHCDINLRAMFFTMQAAARHMKETGGSIVNIASVQGAIFSPRYVPYTATKAGVRGLTSAAAVALAPYGIRVNAVAPGWTDTAMNKIAGDAAAIAQRLNVIPLGRAGTPDDMAEAVAFLAGPGAAYITGQILTVDGGRTLGHVPLPAPNPS